MTRETLIWQKLGKCRALGLDTSGCGQCGAHGSDCMPRQRMMFRYKFWGHPFGENCFVESTRNYTQHFPGLHFGCPNPPSLSCPRTPGPGIRARPYRGQSKETPPLLGNPRDMRSLRAARGGRGSYLTTPSSARGFHKVTLPNAKSRPVLQIQTHPPARPAARAH